MKKKKVDPKHYFTPQCEIVQLDDEFSLLVGSEIRPTPGSGTPSVQIKDNNQEEEELEFN